MNCSSSSGVRTTATAPLSASSQVVPLRLHAGADLGFQRVAQLFHHSGSHRIHHSGQGNIRQLQAAHSLPDHVRLAPVPHGRAARHNSQRRREAELLADRHTQALRLGGGQRQRISPLLQPRKQLPQTRRGLVFILAHRLVPLPENLHAPGGGFRVIAAVGHEGLLQGRADEFDEGALRRHRLPQLVKGIPQAVEDALLGVCQRAVQIKENIVIHTLLPLFFAGEILSCFALLRKRGAALFPM